MTFNPNADVRGKSATRRGGRGAVVAGGAGVGVIGIAVLLISLFTGQDFSGLLGGSPGGGTGSEGEALQNCATGADANNDDACRLDAGEEVINSYWQNEVEGYRAPDLVLVEQQTSSPCGTASNQTGPFYCPTDETVYIDPTFWSILRNQLGAEGGEFAQLYVLAHEYGHHVQHLTGIFEDHPRDGTGEDSNAVRTELQADCFAGAWAAEAPNQKDASGQSFLQKPTQAQIDDALSAASAVGDDHIQQQSGRVNPESWTHGSSEQRQRWFMAGYTGGSGACDTFSVSGQQL
ncbi:KPN_02809 family neutral zinc metallopeptidase [Microbacterium aquilitoris]|uniref:KPN_02809 family neutral zinc metallopeptidase n=1 Tax=Microbacterium aquilitoris TaxID=3067307 RepID=UPI002891AC0D|nr:neutral zinc metallopeptidase [Microbacterium sp. KSW2-22]MDT3345456.1 neutral zinc metallopeptidase [Microbacterium sp. KSW2-22]